MEKEAKVVLDNVCKRLVPESNVLFVIANMGIVTVFLLPSVYALAMLVYDAFTQQVPSNGDVTLALGGLFLTAIAAIAAVSRAGK